MEHIKITDLCVGDWVMYEGNHRKVALIDGGNGLIKFALSPNFVGTGAIEPILLTHEIMVANGFECIDIGDRGVSTPKQHYMRYEKWRGETQWGYRELFYDRMTKMWRFGGMNEYRFNSVHKLQHAMRFSGWDKEIEL